ncbi:hypothetical protein D4S03_02275 [bacterium]|nr:MAG: hypothetical protein D4S03_02275 [bacterium]
MLSEELKSRLLNSIQNDNFIIFCGAGLSMAAPSNLPSAVRLAQQCTQRYHSHTGNHELIDIQDDLEKIAQFFYRRHEFGPVFIQRIVPWSIIRQAIPNKGHSALADFLACGASKAVITTNFDHLIESAANDLGEPDFEASIDGNEMNYQRDHHPLLKLHGCVLKDKRLTLWCADQLETPQIRARIESSATWLNANLKERDLIFIGFWTDWAYLNNILENCVSKIEPRMVLVVDPADSEVLKEKAGGLWAWAETKADFHHIQQSGAEFLTELRKSYSLQFLNILLLQSKTSYQALIGSQPPDNPNIQIDLDIDDLYELRRDTCGAPKGQVVRKKVPDAYMNPVGVAILFLQEKGAKFVGSRIDLRGIKVRVVQGSGQPLSIVKSTYESEPPDPDPADIVICAGALQDGNAPVDIVRGDAGGTIIRAGLQGTWLTLQDYIDIHVGG